MFFPATIQPHTSVYSVFCAVHATYTTHATKQRTWLCMGISSYFPCFVAVVCRVHPAMLHRLQGAGGHTSAQSASTDTRYHHHAGRCTAQHNRPIIIRYIRVQVCAPVVNPCQTAQHIADMPARRGLDAPHARRLAVWHRSAVSARRVAPSTRRAVQ